MSEARHVLAAQTTSRSTDIERPRNVLFNRPLGNKMLHIGRRQLIDGHPYCRIESFQITNGPSYPKPGVTAFHQKVAELQSRQRTRILIPKGTLDVSLRHAFREYARRNLP